MKTEYLPDTIKNQINSYNQMHSGWVAMKIFNMATCAVALLSTLAADKEHRDDVLGISLGAGLAAYGIQRREENKKKTIENDLRHFDNFQTMSWEEKENYFHAEKVREKKEKEGVKMMGVGAACFIIGQPVLGSILTVGGLLHNTTSRDFIKVQERILDNHERRLYQRQNERS